jgi:ornithine decarboxylase
MLPSRIDATINLWKQELPMVQPFYAVKCNPEPRLLEYLIDKNIGFDCASERELTDIRTLSRTKVPNRIVYANPCKSARDIGVAKDVGSPITVVDSVEEIEKLADLKYEGGALIRLAVDDTGSDMPFSSKFGAQPQAVKSIAQMAYQRSIQLCGFSFHVGSGSRDPMAYPKAIHQCLNSVEALKAAGHSPTILDIGGGFLPDSADFREKALNIRDSLLCVDYVMKNAEIWAEPGRFFASNAFDFYVQVIGKKLSDGEYKYTIDDSIYGQFSNILFDKANPTWTRIALDDEPPRRASKGTIFGRTCDSIDVVIKSRVMEELVVGDWLRFPNMGAYTRATATEFNGFPAPALFVLDAAECLKYEDN